MAKHTLKDFLNKYGYLVFVTLLIVLLIVTVLYTKGVSELKDSTTTSSTQKSLLVSPQKSLLVSPPMETSDVNTEEPDLEQTMPPKLGSSNDNENNDNDDDDDSDDGDSDDGDSTDDGSNKNNLYLILFVVGVVLTLLAAMYSFLTTSAEKVQVITPSPHGITKMKFDDNEQAQSIFTTDQLKGSMERASALVHNLKNHAKDNKDQYIMNFLLIFYVVMTFGFYHGENIHTKDKDKKNGKRTYVLSMVEIGLLCLYLLIHSIMSYNEFNKITTQDIRATVGQAYTDFTTNLEPLRSALMRQKKKESQQGGGKPGPQRSTGY